MASEPDIARSRKSVVVIGGGISGLCVAYWLKKRSISVTLLEREAEPGGTMKTIRDGGWLIESGPNSALETTPLIRQLVEELGLTEQFLYANKMGGKRYIVRNGSLHPLPMTPLTFLTSKLWTLQGKLRLLKEPFIGRARKEESVAGFVERRLGREFLDYAINPFVAGVYAGKPEQLSVRAAFPKLHALEESYGSLVIGALKSRKERKSRNEVAKNRARLFSFSDGMQALPRALAASLGTSVITGCFVEAVIPMRAGKFPIYTVYYRKDDLRMTLDANVVVFSAPAHVTSEVVRPIDPEMSTTLASISYPPVAEVFMGFRHDQVKRSLDGFGFLVPEKEHRKILGCIWSSALFPGRAPEGFVGLTSFVGGSRQPELLEQDDQTLQKMVLGELVSIMGIGGVPAFSHVIRWQKAIPQYNLGYQKILSAIDRFEQNFQGSYICSNYCGGIAVGDCLMSAERIARRVEEHLLL